MSFFKRLFNRILSRTPKTGGDGTPEPRGRKAASASSKSPITKPSNVEKAKAFAGTTTGLPQLGSSWHDIGMRLQPISDLGGGRALPIRLGLDFGTALTKAAVRVADSVFFINWNDLSKGTGYLLPGRIVKLSDGSLSLSES